ncbi:MAG: hypothetical protein JXK07_09390 [Spirochaetes bacterium]|nr:hypothetical protein [Spirochaetota bacterium]MBN2772484.1 hypothetical protein [Spirochaetota bacterium]
MQSVTDPNVFACGDCAEKPSFFTGRPVPVLLASIATSEARIAGSNLYSPVHQNCGASLIIKFCARRTEKCFETILKNRTIINNRIDKLIITVTKQEINLQA